VTVNSVNQDAWPAVQAANKFNSPPPQGSVDFLVNLNIHFEGNQPSNVLDLTIQVVGQSGVAISSQHCGVLPHPGSPFDVRDVFPGATFALNVCWQVPQSEVSSLEMYWRGNLGAVGPFWALH
jgi:hypothetical protein